MTVRQRLCYICIFIFKIVKGILARLLSNRIEIVREVSGGQTKQTENNVIQLRRRRNVQKSLFCKGVKMCNVLPAELKQCERLVMFKRMSREYIVSTDTGL